MVKNQVKLTSNTFHADSAASHMEPDDTGMTNVRKINMPMQVCNSNHIFATKVGDKHIRIKNFVSLTDSILKDYKGVPEFWVSLFSVTKALSTGWNLGNDKTTIYVKNTAGVEVHSDQMILTDMGYLVGCDMIPRTGCKAQVGNVGQWPQPSHRYCSWIIRTCL